jgi:hypothetical protein
MFMQTSLLMLLLSWCSTLVYRSAVELLSSPAEYKGMFLNLVAIIVFMRLC